MGQLIGNPYAFTHAKNIQGLDDITPEELENSVFILKTCQMFSFTIRRKNLQTRHFELFWICV